MCTPRLPSPDLTLDALVLTHGVLRVHSHGEPPEDFSTLLSKYKMSTKLWSLVWLCQMFTSIYGNPMPVSKRQNNLTTFDRVVVSGSPANWTSSGTLYGRAIQLADSSLLTTWENYSPEPPLVYFPIYRSTDYGKTWSELSKVEDQVRGYGLRYQPVLYTLPGPLGSLPSGTLLLCGNAIPEDLSSTHLELYASRDGGATWEFVSHIADGGRALPNNGETPIWEPFMLYHDGQLVVYYSDQRDPAYGQKLVHQITRDGLAWSDVVNDVRETTYDLRPGMPTLAQMANGSWILTYENVNYPGENAPVFYKISDDPFSWDDKTGIALVTSNGSRPRSSPFVVVDDSGRVLVSGGQGSEIYFSDNNGAPGSWNVVTPPQERSYTRCLTLIKQAGRTKQYLMVTGGGWFGNGPNNVTVGIDDASAW